MKTMHTTNYKLYNRKTNDEFRICLMNDLHFSEGTTNEKLKMILEKLEKLEPNYTMIPGDLIDSINVLDDLENKKRLLIWLKEIGQLSKTFVSLGSHDYCRKHETEKNKLLKWQYDYPYEFFDEVNDQPNVHVLNNKSFEDSKIFVTGYTQSMHYFNPIIDKRKRIFDKNIENKELMLEELKKLRETIINIPKDKVNFIMVHSPVYLKDYDIEELLKGYDYYISGHMHNGMVPPILNEIWMSNRGIIAPSRDLFPKNSRNTFKQKEDKLIVNAPLTTFHENHGMFSKFNFLYPSYISVIDFSKDIAYATNKIYTKRYYGK